MRLLPPLLPLPSLPLPRVFLRPMAEPTESSFFASLRLMPPGVSEGLRFIRDGD